MMMMMMMMMIVWKLLVFKNSLKPAPKSGVESNETGDSCAKTKPDKSFTTSRCVVPPLIKFILESLQKTDSAQLVCISPEGEMLASKGREIYLSMFCWLSIYPKQQKRVGT